MRFLSTPVSKIGDLHAKRYQELPCADRLFGGSYSSPMALFHILYSSENLAVVGYSGHTC